jgi:hypothetical protein
MHIGRLCRNKRDLPMRTNSVLPVLISILVIITIALLQRQNKLVAAITATMPINVALGYWIVAAASNTDRQSVTDFSRGMLLGILPTVVFLGVLWLASRAGLRSLIALGLGYLAWGLGTGLILLLRQLSGLGN